MSQRACEFIGGLWDGLTLPLEDPPDWVWLEGHPERVRRPSVHDRRAQRRLPYYAVYSTNKGSHVQAYIYAGNTHTHCAGCGCHHALHDDKGRRVVRCGLCGHAL